MVHALIPAAGRGERLGGDRPKQYLPLAGRPLLAHAVLALGLHPAVRDVTVAVAPDDRSFAALSLQLRDELPVPLEQVPGGATRAESVLSGLRHLDHDDPQAWVLVHDAARPCLEAAAIDRLLAAGLGHEDGAILALPVRDTLKLEDRQGRIAETLDRSGAWAAQTPQLFPVGALRRALEDMLASGASPTDEASAMEWTGARPRLVQGSVRNLKVTWPEDLQLAASYLAQRETGTS